MVILEGFRVSLCTLTLLNRGKKVQHSCRPSSFEMESSTYPR